MKRSIFAVFAALTLLLAAPAVAQQEETELEPYESRTNPDADSITEDSGLTITGTVVEWNDEQLTLRTTTGVEHIQILPNTDRPVELTAGENVTVDYTRTSQGVMIAQEIRAEGADTDVATTELQTDTRTDTTRTETELEADVDTNLDTGTTTDRDLDADARLDTQAGLETDVDTDLDTEADADFRADADLDTTLDDQDSLPATGSDLPLVALLGLLSVAAALGVRSYIR